MQQPANRPEPGSPAYLRLRLPIPHRSQLDNADVVLPLPENEGLLVYEKILGILGVPQSDWSKCELFGPHAFVDGRRLTRTAANICPSMNSEPMAL